MENADSVIPLLLQYGVDHPRIPPYFKTKASYKPAFPAHI